MPSKLFLDGSVHPLFAVQHIGLPIFGRENLTVPTTGRASEDCAAKSDTGALSHGLPTTVTAPLSARLGSAQLTAD